MKVNLRLLLILCCAFSACRDGDNNNDDLCGNNVVDTGEECDDGNTTGGDGCGDTCLIEVAGVCGDGTRNTGEGCDDGNVVDGDGCDASCQVELVETICQELAPIATGTCEVAAGDATTALVGDVLVPEGIFRGGTVLVDAMGVISCVGCDCDTTGATVVTCPQGVISPGLINSHEHITFANLSPYTDTGERYEHRHDWREGIRGHTELFTPSDNSSNSILWGELRYLLGGATSLNGSGQATGFLRNLDRSAQGGLGQPQVQYQTFPLDDSSGRLSDNSCDYGSEPDTMSDIASEDAYTPHISEGIDDEARNEFICTSSNDNGANDLLESQSAYIHGVGLGAQEYKLMADSQTKLIWSPRSNITLYGETARVALADNLGVTIALGTDWIATGSMNMQRELTCADSFNNDHLGGHFTDADLWQMVTLNAAIATATDDVIGSLAAGKVADIAIYDGSTNLDYRAVIDARAQDTVMVMRGGEVLFGEESVVGALGLGTCDTIDICGSSRQLCAENDIGMGYTALRNANPSHYADFFCGEPENEPSCVPFRPLAVDGSSTYTGIVSAGDMDADGIENASDNCPSIFNPIRPLDHGMQADADNDGEGDSCDPCPLDADTTTCSLFDPNDADGDGVPVATDNCPNDANPGQEDRDNDNIGDICDACPDFSNLGGVACQVTIYEIKAGTVTGAISLPETVISACFSTRGYFLQTAPGDADYTVPENSALFVYDPTTDCGVTIGMGDKVVIGNAVVNEFFGQVQLTDAMFTVNSSGNTLPTPIVLTPAQAGGTVANEYEGIIAQVENVTASSIISITDFEVDSALLVSGDIFVSDPFPVVGSVFPSIAGVLMLRDGVQGLRPRMESDILQGDPRLIGLSPALSYVDEGATNVATGPQALEVVLSHAVTAATFVAVTSGSADLTVVGGGVTIGVGQERGTVLVSGIAQNAGVTLTATLDAVMVTADVRVLGAAEVAAIASISPIAASISPNGSVTLTVNLDIPAGVGGALVALSSSDASVTVPANVTVAAGQVSATFDATGGATAGSATVTATLNGTATATVDVVDGGLVINEVDYDQPMGDTEEFVEIYNGSGGTQSLANLSLVFMNGSGAVASEYDRVDLSPEGSLAPGQYLVVGAASVVALVPGTEKTIVFTGSIQNGGPDAVGLYNSSTDELVDALSYEGSTSGPVTNGGTFNFVEGTELDGMQADVGADGSLSRLPNGSDTDDANTDWAFTSNSTPGAANN